VEKEGGNVPMKLRQLFFFFAVAIFLYCAATVSTTLTDFFLSGSQPNQSGTFATVANGCSCHSTNDLNTSIVENWSGGMMAQAARDPLWYASFTIANQDAAFAGDLCIRCHSPIGWLEGRSTPTDGSALTANDRGGVACEFCHRLVKPFPAGTNPYPFDTYYNTVVSGYNKSNTITYKRDSVYSGTLTSRPVISANGMYVVDSDGIRRGPRSDAEPKHDLYYSAFHRDAALCGTCHDVSNPVFQKQTDGSGNVTYVLTNLNEQAPSFDLRTQFPVERTYSEWTKSAFNTTPGGIYAPEFGGAKSYVSICQDCHMRDVSGRAASGNPPMRSDLALHDMTGGNTFIPSILGTFFPSEITQSTLDSGKSRATRMLKLAATMALKGAVPDGIVEVTNKTAHKLPSGYPEGRRIWLNVKAYDGNKSLIQEFGAYNSSSGVLTKSDTRVYEIKLAMSDAVQSATGLSNDADGSSFHFALNNVVIKDNRIPPQGFTNANFAEIQSPPVGATYADGQYWDNAPFTLPSGTRYVVADLYYQSTSKDYIEFLRDNNTTNDWGTRLYNAWNTSGKSTPVLMARAGSLTSPLPLVRVTGGSYSSSSPTPGTTNFPLLKFTTSSGTETATWNMLSVTVTGSYASSDITNFKLWKSSDDTFEPLSDTQLGSTVATISGNGATVSFSGFTETTALSDKYYFVSADIPSGANTSATFQTSISKLSSFGFASLAASDAANVFPIVGNDNALPVTLKSFTAVASGFMVKIQWETAVEVNSSRFEIERKKVNVSEEWKTIASVSGSGTSNTPTQYFYYDNIPNAGTYAYRLKQYDNDGKLFYYNSVEVKAGIFGKQFYVQQNYPNPFNGRTVIEFVVPKTGNVEVSLFNSAGQFIQTIVQGNFEGEIMNQVVLDGSLLSSGVYFYEVKSGEFRITKRLVMVK
jgi:hypothetical protein